MSRFALLAFLGIAAFAQTAAPPPEEQPPADVDQALRERVNQFYTMLKNQEYRKAESLIAEDTKEYYYTGNKPEIHSFQLLDVKYSDGFTRAKAMTKVTEPMVVAGFPATEISVTMPTLWKIEDGKWCIYEEPVKMHAVAGFERKIQDNYVQGVSAAGKSAYVIPEVDKMPKDPNFVIGKVTVDQKSVTLVPGVAQQIQIRNGSQGAVRLEAGAPLAGVEAKLDRTGVGPNEKAVLTLKAEKGARGGLYSFRLMPTEERLDIMVLVQE